jgi:hypothetical protein
MSLSNLLTSAVLLSSVIIAAQAGITQKDFTGIGHIFVLKSDDWSKATPQQKVGCLDDDGRFINEDAKGCGVFARLDKYPYTLSSKSGNCTFDDSNTPANTDSHYGKQDHAWTCNATYMAVIYDELYTIVSLSDTSDRNVKLTNFRTASATPFSASATSHATTTRKLYPRKARHSPSGSTVGARSSSGSRLDMCNCSYCGTKLVMRQNVRL